MQPQRDFASLTPGELDVVRAYSHGLEGKAAADVLGVHSATVKDRAWRLRHKIAAKNMQHAVALCLRAGVID